jgi:predicted O-methyltransferase YrrM
MLTDEQFTDILNSCGGRLSIADAKILYRLALELEAKVIVEIGSKDGCSSMTFAEACKQTGGHLYCIEPSITGKWIDNMKRLDLVQYATIVHEASPWLNPLSVPIEDGANVNSRRWPIIDLLLIDGDHRTRWTITDYHFWEPYVRTGGIIVFHDWTGANGVGAWVQRAVSIILEDDADGLVEVARNESNSRGLIAFRKTAETSLSRRWRS